VKLSTKLGGKQGASQKSVRAMAHPGPPWHHLRTATVHSGEVERSLRSRAGRWYSFSV